MPGGRKQESKVIWPGFSNVALPRHAIRVGRNDPCPCGGGKKYKDCHEKQGSAYLRKLALEDEKRQRKELRKALKARGVPWYKRLFYRS